MYTFAYPLPIKIKKNSNKVQDVCADLIMVNNVFAHWIKEIDVKRYEDDFQILPTFR